jgi:hypothetical protein
MQLKSKPLISYPTLQAYWQENNWLAEIEAAKERNRAALLRHSSNYFTQPRILEPKPQVLPWLKKSPSSANP